jgi:excisionase family DNA binding protein
LTLKRILPRIPGLDSSRGADTLDDTQAMGAELSPDQACDRLGCSRPTVLRFVKEGKIRIVRREKPEGQQGRVWYDAEDVERVKRTWERRRRRPQRRDAPPAVSEERGRVARIAYPMFRAGYADPDVVIETGADPMLIRQLRRLYSTTDADDRAEALRKEREERELSLAREHERTKRVELYSENQARKDRLAQRTADEAARAARRAARRRPATPTTEGTRT